MGEGDSAGFGPLLRQLRTACGLSQEALAEAAGLSARGIQELERGDHRPYRDTLERLTRALGLGEEDAARLAFAGRPRCREQPARPSRVDGREAVPSAEPALRSANRGSAAGVGDQPLHDLPAELTSFVGREREIARVRELLGRARLLTLTGAGGCGKTRLARRVAGEVVGEYPGGVWLVELASIADPGLACQSVAAALYVRERPSQPLLDTLRAELRDRRCLLLLDNCEHVVDECAKVAETLLRYCPGVRVLATSREALRAAGEVTFAVPPLAIPAAGQPIETDRLAAFDSVALLVERARAVQPAFRVTGDNARAVAEIVTRLDGMPLALELAAARLDSLSIQQLAARIDHPFHLLVSGPRTAPLRQRTLREAVDWSYRLLTDRERALFGRLSLLGTRFSLEAAEGICSGPDVRSDDVLELLSCLVRKSLVLAEEHSGETHYRLLETIREYARSRLAEAAESSGDGRESRPHPRATGLDGASLRVHRDGERREAVAAGAAPTREFADWRMGQSVEP